MNIFFINKDPVLAAQDLVDDHVIKMITESGQLLSIAHRVLDGCEIRVQYITKKGKKRTKSVWVLPDHRNDILYNVTHKNHPCAIWVRTAVENYNWLVDHMFAMGDEYTRRYGKVHKTIRELGYDLQSPPYNLEDWDWTEPAMCMPEEYIISNDPVENYRNFYKYGKAHLHTWKNKERPDWLC